VVWGEMVRKSTLRNISLYIYTGSANAWSISAK
jgi:hypothetical protein